VIYLSIAFVSDLGYLYLLAAHDELYAWLCSGGFRRRDGGRRRGSLAVTISVTAVTVDRRRVDDVPR